MMPFEQREAQPSAVRENNQQNASIALLHEVMKDLDKDKPAQGERRNQQLEKMAQFLADNYDKLAQHTHHVGMDNDIKAISPGDLMDFALKSNDRYEQHLVGSVLKNFDSLSHLFTYKKGDKDDIDRADVYTLMRVAAPERVNKLNMADPFLDGRLRQSFAGMGTAAGIVGGGVSGFVVGGIGSGGLGAIGGGMFGASAIGFLGYKTGGLLARGIYRLAYGSSDNYYSDRKHVVDKIVVPRQY